jgi:hypothetical protein
MLMSTKAEKIAARSAASKRGWQSRKIAALMTDKDRIEQLEDALRRIYDWSRAYPVPVFPEPDWNKARVLLEAGGMTLDSISASNMRLVIKGVGEIAEKALKSC